MIIGDDVIIAAGVVVIKDVPSDSVMAGVPARVVKTIDPSENWVEFRKNRNRAKANE